MRMAHVTQNPDFAAELINDFLRLAGCAVEPADEILASVAFAHEAWAAGPVTKVTDEVESLQERLLAGGPGGNCGPQHASPH